GGASVTSVTIPAGSSSVSFYYGATLAGTPTITASGPLTSALQQETITPAAVDKLLFVTAPSGNQTATATATIGAYQIQEQDQFANPVTASSAVAVSLSSSSTGTKFFSTASGGVSGTQVSSVTIANGGTSTGNFYYADTKAGTPTLTAHATGI